MNKDTNVQGKVSALRATEEKDKTNRLCVDKSNAAWVLGFGLNVTEIKANIGNGKQSSI